MRLIEGPGSESDNSEEAPRRHPSAARAQFGSDREGDTAELLASYRAHLDRSPLSRATRRAYAGQVRTYLTWLVATPDSPCRSLSDPLDRDFAVRDYRRHLRETHLAPASINAALSALGDLYRFAGLGPPGVRPERLGKQAPRALSEAELRAVLRAAERRGSARDRAVIALMAYAGLRIAEVASLDVADVAISARKGLLLVRCGKGEQSRTVPLGAELRALVAAWIAERPEASAPALFLSRSGERLSVRSLDRVVRKTGELAGIRLSAHVLRHTFVTRLVRAGVDVVLVAELAGYRSLETTRRYSLPSEADRQAAVELAGVEP